MAGSSVPFPVSSVGGDVAFFVVTGGGATVTGVAGKEINKYICYFLSK